MAEVMTNRDLYCFVAGLVKERSECSGTLQSYLENLRRLGRSLRDREAVSLQEFAELLRAAFNPELSTAEPSLTVTDGYIAWEKRITDQIRDLDEMRQAGTLDNEYRYFGVDAPRGGRWYNFDPCTYLECAAAGTFGGWQESDDTGRSYVPGPVAVLDPSGAITSVDPRDIDDPVVALPQITWEMFVEFLDAGQWYE
jgi:hypothetical protein